MNRPSPLRAMPPQPQAELRFVLGALLALAILAGFIGGIHLSL